MFQPSSVTHPQALQKSLKGRLILDCSALLPGPMIGKLLALQGARVVKIENPSRPDGAKRMGPIYRDLNSLKEIIQLDLTNSVDRKKFHRWVEKADGLIEGFRPAAKRKLGLDSASLHPINPSLCIVSLVGYPEDGPWKDRAGHDLNFAAVTGCASLFHEMPALPLADLFSSYRGAFALTAAMDSVSRARALTKSKQKSAKPLGKRVVISMTDSLLEVQGHVIEQYKESGQIPNPGQTLFSGKFPCYRIYAAKEGRRISVGAIEEKFWEKICEILKLGHLSKDGYATGSRGKEVIAAVQAAFQSHPWSHWAPLFENADCCVEPILEYNEVFGEIPRT